MKVLFKSFLAALLILCLSTCAFAWGYEEKPILKDVQKIEVNTPVEVKSSDAHMLYFSFRLTEAGYLRIEIDQPLADDTHLGLYIGDDDSQALLYDTALSTGENFLSPQIGIDANSTGYYPDNYYIAIENVAENAEFTLTVHYTQTSEWEIEPNDGWTGDDTQALDLPCYGTIHNEEDIDFFHFEIEERSRVYVTFTSFDGKPFEDFWNPSFSTNDVMYQVENPILIKHSASKVTYDLGVIWDTRLHVQNNAIWDWGYEITSHDPSVYSVEVHADPTDSFPDVKETAFYSDAVKWAINEYITEGTSRYDFSPEALCTRGQIVTFLSRMYSDLPFPDEYEEVFTDLNRGASYYYPVYWAYANEIVQGTSATTFSPNAPCTRAQAVTFLWRFAGCPKTEARENPFADVKENAYYYDAISWAVENGITLGTSETTFSPNAVCTRGQIVTFLYRYSN